MTVETVKAYFLKAGASFRTSDAWKNAHEDSRGHSKVSRSGRFGVGALAVFLIGDEIEVTTRHISANYNQAITFKASLDSASIPLLRTSAPTGTTIRISVPNHMRAQVANVLPKHAGRTENPNDRLCSYILRSPSLRISIDGEKDPEPDLYVPQEDGHPASIWRFFETEDFGRVFWTYGDARIPRVTCNGFIIERGSDAFSRKHVEDVVLPDISAFDPDGKLPINLQRDRMFGELIPFKKALVESVAKDIVSCSIVSYAENYASDWFNLTHPAIDMHRPTSLDVRDWSLWAIGSQGFILAELELIRRYVPDQIIFTLTDQQGFGTWADIVTKHMSKKGLIITQLLEGASNRPKSTFKDACKLTYLPRAIKASATRVYVHESLVRMVINASPGREVQACIDALKRIDRTEWYILESGDLGQFTPNPGIFDIRLREFQTLIFCEIIVSKIATTPGPTTLCDQWLIYVEDFLVPISRSLRQDLENRHRFALFHYNELNRRESKEYQDAESDRG